MNKIKLVKGLSWGAAAISTAEWSGALLKDVLRLVEWQLIVIIIINKSLIILVMVMMIQHCLCDVCCCNTKDEQIKRLVSP